MSQDINERILQIINGLSRTDRRKGDNDVSLIVLHKFTEGPEWTKQGQRSVAVEVRSRARAILRELRTAKAIPSKLIS